MTSHVTRITGVKSGGRRFTVELYDPDGDAPAMLAITDDRAGRTDVYDLPGNGLRLADER